jgi:putative transposase
MKRTIAIKLNFTQKQHQAFLALQELFGNACNEIAKIAVQKNETNKIRLHHSCYYLLREKFPKLGAQMCCNAISKTTQALKALKRPREILFRQGISIHFDKRTYSLKNGVLSLFTLEGRERVIVEISPFQANYFSQGIAKEAELVRKGKQWFFHLVLDLPQVPFLEEGKILAVDFGENNLASTSTGRIFGGGPLKAQRGKFLGHRSRLQSNGSQSAKQRLRHISGQERRHVRYVNHCVSKEIILEAKKNGCTTLVLEDLKNIRLRIRANKRVRSRLHRWSFDELRQFVEYKALAEGMKVIYVNPAYTSVICSCCLSEGHRLKHRFFCSNCGSRQHSDLNASQNLLRLGSTAVESTGIVNCRHVAA